MKFYKVISIFVNITSGILSLTEEQYQARKHLLSPLGQKDEKAEYHEYLVKGRVQFKRGETLGYDGEVNNSLLQHIEEMDEDSVTDVSPEDKKLLQILKGNVTQVHNSLYDLSVDELRKITVLEIQGKNNLGRSRQGVLDAIGSVLEENRVNKFLLPILENDVEGVEQTIQNHSSNDIRILEAIEQKNKGRDEVIAALVKGVSQALIREDDERERINISVLPILGAKFDDIETAVQDLDVKDLKILMEAEAQNKNREDVIALFSLTIESKGE